MLIIKKEDIMLQDEKYSPFPIEYMDREEASKYKDALQAKKEAETVLEPAYAEYLSEVKKAYAIREQDEMEYSSIRRDAKSALKKQKEPYDSIIKNAEALINKVNPDSIVKPVIVDADQHAESLRKKMDGSLPSKNAQKMAKSLAQLITQSPETALDQFVDQIKGLNPVEIKTIKATLEPDYKLLKLESAKGVFSLTKSANVDLLKTRIGNLLDKISTPEYKITEQEKLQKLGPQAQYLNRLQNKVAAVLDAWGTLALEKQEVDKQVQNVVVNDPVEVPPSRHDIKEDEKVKSAPPGFDPKYRYSPSVTDDSLLSTSGGTISSSPRNSVKRNNSIGR